MLHIAREEDWLRAQERGSYRLPHGVIHGCSQAQLQMVVDAHFPETEGWLVLTVDESRVEGEIRWVTFTEGGSSQTFPHLHGSFPVEAVREIASLASCLDR